MVSDSNDSTLYSFTPSASQGSFSGHEFDIQVETPSAVDVRISEMSITACIIPAPPSDSKYTQASRQWRGGGHISNFYHAQLNLA